MRWWRGRCRRTPVPAAADRYWDKASPPPPLRAPAGGFPDPKRSRRFADPRQRGPKLAPGLPSSLLGRDLRGELVNVDPLAQAGGASDEEGQQRSGEDDRGITKEVSPVDVEVFVANVDVGQPRQRDRHQRAGDRDYRGAEKAPGGCRGAPSVRP